MNKRLIMVGLLLIATQLAVGCCGRRAYVRSMRHNNLSYSPDAPFDCCAPACNTCMKNDGSPVMLGTPVAMGSPMMMDAPLYQTMPFAPSAPAPQQGPVIQEGVTAPQGPAPLPAPMRVNPGVYLRPIR